MAITCNIAILLGYVGKDAELKYTKNKQKAILTFDMATSVFTGGKNYTTWHRVVVWGQLAEAVAKYIRKGALVFVEGSNEKNKYKVDNQSRTYQHIKAKKIICMGEGAGESDGGYPEDWDDIDEEIDL